MNSKFYSMLVEDCSGKRQSLEIYEGKTLLIVNTASLCGFTKQYAELESLYQKYKEHNFEILAFPCNQFGEQEPGSNDEIQKFCSLKFGVKFKVFSKVDVNGENAHPLFSYLTDEVRGLLGTKTIKWNFTKFLVNSKGNIVKRFSPFVKPGEIAPFIDKILVSQSKKTSEEPIMSIT